jgi:hypothetical protein
MMKTEDVSETPTKSIADEVSDAVGNLATIALSSGGDLEKGGGGGGDEGETTVTNTLIKSVAKSMVNKVSAENSISFARRTATYCWSKISSSLTKQNLIDTFGRDGSLRRVGLEAVNCKKFSRPAGAGDWRRRIALNFPHFKTLYLAFTVIITAWSLLFNMWIMSGCLMLVLGWYYFNPLATLFCRMEEPSAVQKFTIMIPITIVVALLTGIVSKVIELVTVSIIATATHASFHQGVDTLPVTTSEEDDGVAIEEVPMATLEEPRSSDGAVAFSGDIEKDAIVGHDGNASDDDVISDDDNDEQ